MQRPESSGSSKRQHSHPSQSVLPSPSTPERGRADGACTLGTSRVWKMERGDPQKIHSSPASIHSHRAAQPCGDTTLTFFWRPCVVHRNSFPWQMRRNHSFPHIICAWLASFCSFLAVVFGKLRESVLVLGFERFLNPGRLCQQSVSCGLSRSVLKRWH